MIQSIIDLLEGFDLGKKERAITTIMLILAGDGCKFELSSYDNVVVWYTSRPSPEAIDYIKSLGADISVEGNIVLDL